MKDSAPHTQNSYPHLSNTAVPTHSTGITLFIAKMGK